MLVTLLDTMKINGVDTEKLKLQMSIKYCEGLMDKGIKLGNYDIERPFQQNETRTE